MQDIWHMRHCGAEMDPGGGRVRTGGEMGKSEKNVTCGGILGLFIDINGYSII